MNKASCLSLLSNAVLAWNTVRMTGILDQRSAQPDTRWPMAILLVCRR